MIFQIITAHNKRNVKLTNLFFEQMKLYCEKNNYQFKIYEENFLTSQVKPKFILDALQNAYADYIVWIDADIFILDLNFKLETLIDIKEMYFSYDHNGICAGFIIIKKCDFCIKFFETINFLDETYNDSDLIPKRNYGGFLSKNGKHFDQNTIKVVLDFFKKFENKIGIISENIIQNSESLFYDKPFAFHFWCIWDHANKVEKIIELLKKKKYFNLKNWRFINYI
jgi:hypothetical protein